jgi:outer membrane protein OmpA-like peptidoglycan-associated protein
MKPFSSIIAFAILFLIPITVVCQKTELKKAESYYDRGEYFAALENYLLAQEAGLKPDIETKKKIARCYYYLNNVDKAFELFFEMEDQLSGKDIFLFASTRHRFGDYEGAIEWYEKAKKEGENPIQINELIKSCQWALTNQEFLPVRVTPSAILTFGQSFGIQYYKKGVVYSSASGEGNKKNVDKQGNSFLNLYYSDIVDGQIQPEKRLFSKNLVFPYHVGAISFSPDFNTMYFTKSVRVRGGKSLLKLYSVEFDGTDWGNETELSINSNEYDCAHPAVSPDGKFLYFVSNKKGGYGGKDLYGAEIKGKNKFGEVTNLGKDVNSFGEEMFPVVNSDNILYFSSDGHYGFGGLDIFSAEFINGRWTNVRNMMKPINSNYDDFGYVIDPSNPKLGFLSSMNFGDHQKDNIFYVSPRAEDVVSSEDRRPIAGMDLITDAKKEPVEQPVVKPVEDVKLPDETTKLPGGLSALITSTFNGSPVVGATVVVRDANTGEIVAQATSNAAGKFEIVIPAKFKTAEQEFEIELSKGNEFIPKKMIVNIQELEDLQKGGFTLTPIFNDVVLDDISGMVIPYRGDEITAEGYKILDRLAAYLLQNPNIVIKLNGHTEARGNRFTNLMVSQQASETAESYLVKKGINEQNIIPRGYSERYLLNRCKRGIYCEDAEHLKNRRIEVVVWRILQ